MKITNCGRTYTYTSAPKRVVIGWPRDADTMTALGLGDTVVGYISAKFGPAPRGISPKKLSGDYAPSAETILSAEPDLFIANGDSQLSGDRGSLKAKDLEDIGAHSYVMSLDCKDQTAKPTVEDVYQDITNLGAIFGVPERAVTLIASLKKRVAAAQAMRGSGAAPRVASVGAYQGKLYALNGSLYNTTVTGAGAVNLLASIKTSFSEISAEKVLTLKADAFVCEYYTSEKDTAAKQSAALRKLLGDSPDVANAKIIAVPDYLSEGPGVAAIEAIELVAKQLYG